MKPVEAVIIINKGLLNESREWSIFLRATIKKYLNGTPPKHVQYALEIMSNEQVGWWLTNLIMDSNIVYDEEELAGFDKG